MSGETVCQAPLPLYTAGVSEQSNLFQIKIKRIALFPVFFLVNENNLLFSASTSLVLSHENYWLFDVK